MLDTLDRDNVLATLGRAVSAMQAMDARAITSLWEDDETVFYIAEEIENPLIGRTAIGQYWEANTKVMHRLGVRIGEPRMRALGVGLASVLFPLHWNAVIGKPGGQTLAGDIKVVAILKRSGTDWRFCQWTECALGPLPFLRQVYHRAVDAGFPD